MNARSPILGRIRNRLLALSLGGALAPVSAAECQIGPHTFTVPEGFEVELVAGPPLVERPVSADFDEQGRLYVTDSSGSNEKPDKQAANPTHRVVRLEDTDGDGRFDKSAVFADKVMFPEGALWFDGSLYVAAPPSIWKFTDSDGDGVADKREEWFHGKTLTGCANDLHGPYLGPDGWIYWCKGAFAKQTNTLGNGKTFVSRASHIFRARPDGSGLEPVMTGGMDNPVGLAWTPEGELFVSGTFFQHPGGGRRDGLIHVIYGGVYGKDHDVLDGHKRTGDLMPIMTHLGPAAPCGLTRYESRAFGGEFQNNLFVCQFNLHKVSRHVLAPDGSTFKTRDSDFLVSDNPDFHPTDVREDADGSLIVLDTGGWYKLCCPTSQLAKPDVLGAIYRVRRKGASKVSDPRGLKLAWNEMKSGELAQILDDERPTVVKRAITALVKQGTNAVPALTATLKNSKSLDARRNAVWALTGMDGAKAREAIYAALPDGWHYFLQPSNTAAQAAIYAIGLWRDKNALTARIGESFPVVAGLSKALGGPNGLIQRMAVETFGRIGSADPKFVVRHLLEAPPWPPLDRAREHALIYALIELNEPVATADRLNSSDPSIRRAALVALDQMDGGGLKPEQVTPLLASTNALLKQTANWIVGHRSEWAGALAGFLKERMAVPNMPGAERAELQRQFAQFISDAAVQAVVAAAARDTSAPPASRHLALRVMAESKLKQLPPDWDEAINLCVRGADAEAQRQAIRAARVLPKHSSQLESALARRFFDLRTPADVRLDALLTRRPLRGLDRYSFDFALCHAAATNTVQLRGLAAALLVAMPLTDDQFHELAATLRTLSPLEVTKLLPAFRRCTNEQVGLTLTRTLKGLPYLNQEQVRLNLTNFPATVRAKADELLATLNTDAAKQKAHLEELLAGLKSGDIRRGQAIFNGQKAACSACHAIGYLGGNVGPDLTKIGQIRTERDLLEAVVYPSASFVRSYEPMVVVTKSGEVQSGVLRRDSADEVVLATGPNTEARIARADIAEMQPGIVSTMPQGLDEQLSRQELADLLAFLKATRW